MADSIPIAREFKPFHERAKADLELKEKSRQYVFANWPDPERGVPNEFSRSALFAATQARHRKTVTAEVIASQDGYVITYTGQRLDQTHLDVYEAIMHIARGTHEGNKVRFTAHHLLKLIGRDTGASQHAWLYRTLLQLTATAVDITKDGQQVFWGSLLPRGAGAGPLKRREYAVEITRDLINLFQRGFTQIDWEQRNMLRRKPLAQWLHTYYASHAQPYPVTISFLHEKSGSSTKSLRKFKQLAKAALYELQGVGAITKWWFESDKVHVMRNPSPSQKRYLARSQ
jgi:hypothetical protein